MDDYILDDDLNMDFSAPQFESMGVDTDDNGIDDAFVSTVDSNLDGVPDMIVKGFDYDQDGIIDQTTSYIDGDGDGRFEAVIKEYTAHDGEGSKMATSEIYLDANGDGQVDFSVVQELHDVDGDGLADHIVKTEGYRPEIVSEMASYYYNLNPYEFEVMSPDTLSYTGSISYDEIVIPTFEPTTDYPADIAGDPVADMEHWEYQGDTERCALYSQKFVIEQLTGEEVDIEDVVALAEENGWFDESGLGMTGTVPLNMNKILNEYGIDNDMTFNNSIEDLQQALNNGSKVIVSIDADQVWYGKDSNMFTPFNVANHAVEVIGIDYSDPANPMVILNDSGSPEGCGEMVPLSKFDQAWEAGDRQMITCYA